VKVEGSELTDPHLLGFPQGRITIRLELAVCAPHRVAVSAKQAIAAQRGENLSGETGVCERLWVRENKK
jgi:hypothetical protein